MKNESKEENSNEGTHGKEGSCGRVLEVAESVGSCRWKVTNTAVLDLFYTCGASIKGSGRWRRGERPRQETQKSKNHSPKSMIQIKIQNSNKLGENKR